MNYKVGDTIIVKENPYRQIKIGDKLIIKELYNEGVGGRKGAYACKKDIDSTMRFLLWEEEFEVVHKIPIIGNIPDLYPYWVTPCMSAIRPKGTPLQKQNPMYCNCGSTDTIKNMAAGEVFVYCRACKKERL